MEVCVVADPNSQEPSMYGHGAAATVYIVEIRSTDDEPGGYKKGVAVDGKERNDARCRHILAIREQRNGYVAGSNVVQQAICLHAGSGLDREIGRYDFSTRRYRAIAHTRGRSRCVTGLALNHRNNGLPPLRPFGSVLSFNLPQ